MPHIETFTNNSLILEVKEDDTSIYITWSGRSIDRDPDAFITPILYSAYKNSNTFKKQLIMDFKGIAYMNSSSITPVSKIMELGKQNSNRISIIYDKSKKWQELCFSALKIFETDDKRIEIIGN